MLFLLVFPGDPADFLAQKFVCFTTSVLDSGLSAGRDIYLDPLLQLLFLQPVLNCVKLIALLYNFKALGDLTKKNTENNPSLRWELCLQRPGPGVIT